VISAGRPADEAARLAALRRYEILDTPPEAGFDDLVAVAAQVCQTPMALVCFVDEERQWFKAAVGVSERETARDVAFCAHAILGQELFVVRDALQDPRFADSPLVTAGPRIRFYAGAPLLTPDGHAIGALCVMDRIPRELSTEQGSALLALGRDVVARLELRRHVAALELSLRERDKSRGQLARFVEALPMGVFVTDRSGKAVLTNGKAESLLGFDQTSPLLPGDGANGASGSATDGPAVTRLPVAQAIAGETAVEPDIEIRTAGGRIVHVEAVAAPVYGPSGDVEYAITTLRDVTERILAGRRQVAQQAATRVLAETPSLEDARPRILEILGGGLGWDCGAFWSVDREAGSLRSAAVWSAAPESFQCFMQDRPTMVFPRGAGLAGRAWADAAPVWIPDVRSAAVFVGATTGLKHDLRSAIAVPVALGGDVLGVLELFSRRALPEDPELLGMLSAVGSQVAQFMERDAADRALQVSEDLTRSVVDNMLEGLIVADERGIIESVNASAERIFGYGPHELVGQSVKILLPRSVKEATSYLQDARERSLGRVTEWEGLRRNGHPVSVELSLYEFITPAGKRIAGHVRDISERRALDRMKKEFVATVSHELRTPLTSIRGSLSLLSGGVLGDLPDEAKEVVGIAERNTVRLINLINDILDLERLEAGRMEMRVEPLDVAPIVERSLESVRALAEQEGIRLHASGSFARVQADGDRLVQVIVNLLSNAIKFSPKGADVRVTTTESAQGVEIRVTDRGRGIPEGHRSSIFERFEQVEASDSRRKGGTGLGLAICKAIVEQLGGSIGVESEVGVGSSFWMRLPAAPAPEARVADAPADRTDLFLDSIREGFPDAGGGDVLLVDDDRALLGIMARQILQEGVPVRTAATVGEALIQAWQSAPALVVLDLSLPDADGADVVTALRGVAGLQHTPLLVYTGRDLSAEQRAELHLGPTRFLTKSRSTDAEFRGLVHELLAPSRTERSDAPCVS
jgi:PAS domain S-box-containing protein